MAAPQPIMYFGRDFAQAEEEYNEWVAWVKDGMQGPCPYPSGFGMSTAQHKARYVDHPLDVLLLLKAVRDIHARENAQPQAAVQTTLTEQARAVQEEIDNNPFANGTYVYNGGSLLFRRTLGAIRFMLTSINKANAVRANSLAQANLLALRNQGLQDAAALAQAEQVAAQAQDNLVAAIAQHDQLIVERDIARNQRDNLLANLNAMGAAMQFYGAAMQNPNVQLQMVNGIMQFVPPAPAAPAGPVHAAGPLLQNPNVQAQMANGIMQFVPPAPAGPAGAVHAAGPLNDMDDNLDEDVDLENDA